MSNPINVEVRVRAPLHTAWTAFTDPQHVMRWNHASEDWHSPRAESDLRAGGRFLFRMEAKDGSDGFDFEGTYQEVIPHERIEYVMDDGRKVDITFSETDGITRVMETFDPEIENPREMQQGGWQAILNNFKQYVESLK